MAGRKRSEANKVETAADKFVRLAEQRVGMALKYIRLVANLSGPGYARTVEQEALIVDALEGAVALVKERFAGKPQAVTGFRLRTK